MSIDSWINSSRSSIINEIATNNDLLMDKLNVIYIAPKLWLYLMIWLPRTTDNLIYFAQSLEIRGESRLYLHTYQFKHVFWSLKKEPSHWDGSFEYPQHMFWLRNKKKSVTHSYLGAWIKTISYISQSKHMLWVLKRTVSMRQFFWAPKPTV